MKRLFLGVALVVAGCAGVDAPTSAPADGVPPTAQIIYVTAPPAPPTAQIVYVTQPPTPVVTPTPPPVAVGPTWFDFLTWGVGMSSGIEADWQTVQDGDWVGGGQARAADSRAAIAWLDSHPPMSCYARAHTALRTTMVDNRIAFEAVASYDLNSADLIQTAIASLKRASDAMDATSC